MRCVALAFLLACGGTCIPACGSTPEARVGDAVLAYADGCDDVPPGWRDVVVMPGKPVALPAEVSQLLVAVDRDALFSDVWPLIAAARERGVELRFYAADRRQRVKAMALDPPPDGSVIAVTVTGIDGKACVALPGVEEAKCVMTAQHRVDRAYTRELVREAFKASGLRRVRVEAESGLQWGDVVRAVDGARTCCPGERMNVGIVSL
jgi:hypothetical protein